MSKIMIRKIILIILIIISLLLGILFVSEKIENKRLIEKIEGLSNENKRLIEENEGLSDRFGCGSKPTGRYVNQDNPEQYLEFKPDGNFFLRKGVLSTGTYEIKGNIITLKLPMGVTTNVTIKSNTVVDADSKVWVKTKETREKDAKCAENLQSLYLGLMLYDADYKRYPDSKGLLFSLFNDVWKQEKVDIFICPNVQYIPKKEDLLDKSCSWASYDVTSRELTDSWGENVPIIWDKEGNHTGGRNVLYWGGAVVFFSEEEFQQLEK